MTIRNRILLFFVLPVALTYVVWAIYMTRTGSWGLFADNWYMSLTMVFGSFIAGASPQGGGAVAYPVMTLGFDITAPVARNFSLAIQSVGMTAATLWIVARKVKVDTTYLWLAMAGGTAGIVFASLTFIQYIQPAYAKLSFVSFWLAFGIALFVINHVKKRYTVESIGHLTGGQKLELLLVGFVGGMGSAVYGNGLDVCTFSYVTMKYGLSEKVGTPTSVILMAANAVVGNLMHIFVLGDLQPQAIAFWVVCIPIVVLGAPLGAYVITKFHRLAIAGLLYTLIIAQFVAAMVIIRPAPDMLAVSAGVFALGMAIFFVLTRSGRGRVRAHASKTA